MTTEATRDVSAPKGPPPTDLPRAARTIDRGRWDGEVVGSTTYTYTWGTHTFEAEILLFDDGEGHVRVAAPSDPPPAAEEIVRDGIAAGAADGAVAAALADGWGLDVAQLGAEGDRA